MGCISYPNELMVHGDSAIFCPTERNLFKLIIVPLGTSDVDDELECIKQRKINECIQRQKQLEGSICPVIPKGVVHMGSCDAFSQVFNKYPETPILIYLHAEWCGPCRTMGPLFTKIAEKYASKIFFLDADIDECKDIMTRFRVMGVPSFLIFHRWAEKFRLTGAQTLSAMDNLIQKALDLVPAES